MQRFDAENSVQFTPEELQLIGGIQIQCGQKLFVY